MNNIVDKDICEVLPKGFDLTGACISRGHYEFEKRAIAYLKSQGWKFEPSECVERGQTWKGYVLRNEDGRMKRFQAQGEFTTTDGDSCGPLVRMLFNAQMPDGTFVDLVHG